MVLAVWVLGKAGEYTSAAFLQYLSSTVLSSDKWNLSLSLSFLLTYLPVGHRPPRVLCGFAPEHQEKQEHTTHS